MNPTSSMPFAAPRAIRVLEQAVEAGRRPLLGLGPDAIHPDALQGLSTLIALRRQASGPLAPRWVVAEAELWFLAALAWAPWPVDAPVLFAGNDRVTFVASADIAEPERPVSTWPTGLAWSTDGEALPGARIEPEQIPVLLAEQLHPDRSSAPMPGWFERLLAWSALLLAVGLVAVAWLS